MKNGIFRHKTHLEFIEKNFSLTKSRNDSLITMKDSKIKFYIIYEMAFLMSKIILTQILNQKLFKKIYGFMINKNNSGIPEKNNKNKKIDLLNFQQNSKHPTFYQIINALKSLINKPNLIVENSDISIEKCIEYVELLFDSYSNISFIFSSNIIELIITGKLNDAIFSENNDIKYERTEYKYVFTKILFTLYFDYYSNIYNNNGKTIVKIILKINFPDNLIYSPYLNFPKEKYICKCLMKNYADNKIIRDKKNKYDQFIYIKKLIRRYNFCICFDIINQTKAKIKKAQKTKTRQAKAEFEEINNRESNTEFEEINNRLTEAEFEEINNRTEIIYNSNSENNLVEIDEYKRNTEQIQNNRSFYDQCEIISDELSSCMENYTIINNELSP
jgi:hypothetical protein